ncbi:MAG: protein-L-isoaspartate(D-aspartate) O-methyltransferase [Thermoguttaceae bacterium]
MPVRPIDRWLPWAAICVLAAWPATASAQKHGSPQSLEQARNRMVDQEVVGAGIKDPRVIQSMRVTPRHEFVPARLIDRAYFDMSLPIGERQTISPPMLVAYMTEQLEPQPRDRVLEIGTGSGYQAAVLSPLVKEVYSIEIIESLGKHAKQTLKRLKYANVFVKIGDGYQGWAENAPFDKIIVTCSPEKVPQPLVDQLKEGGRMIIPVGERYQQVLHLLKKQDGELINEALRPTLFVPMSGKAEESRQVQPDPLHPKLINGGFEEVTGTSGEPTGWYYIRQMTVATAPDAPEGRNYATFSNSEPGRGCRALQGFPIDGGKVHELELSCMVRGKDIAPGLAPSQAPRFAIVFLDENRATVGNVAVGPWRGTFEWRRMTGRVKVPLHAREGIVNIGLLGGTGEISYDDVQIRPANAEKGGT